MVSFSAAQRLSTTKPSSRQRTRCRFVCMVVPPIYCTQIATHALRLKAALGIKKGVNQVREQVEKVEFVIREVVNGYFVAEQKLELLMPLLEDEALIHSWDETAGVRAAEALVFTLYMSVLSDMRALLFDPDKRTDRTHERRTPH